MKLAYLVFARWSSNESHFELVDFADSQEDADALVQEQLDKGAIATRVETRQLPENKGGKDAKPSK